MVLNQVIQKEITKHERVIVNTERELGRLRRALRALNNGSVQKPKQTLHWTQRPENAAKVAKRVKLMSKARAKSN